MRILRERGRDDGAERVADHDRRLSNHLQHAVRVVDIPVEPVAARDVARPAMAAEVERVGAVVISDASDHGRPARGVRREPMEEEHGGATIVIGAGVREPGLAGKDVMLHVSS